MSAELSMAHRRPVPSCTDAIGGGAVSAGLKGDHGHDGVTVWGEGACCGPRGFR